ncbi:MAG: hypothetical protein HGA25_10160, partial [Clostridiales bacterium]|nr:hypothetical protein [Clostridiales bacterium]
MPFSDLLNLYCEKIGCTNVALAVASGVDASTISRLRNKNRATRSNRQLVDKLCAGLILLASQADGFENPSEIEAKIKGSLIEEEKHAKETDYNISFNFNTILQELEISNIKLARYLCVDASWISRTRKGERRPTSRENFLDNFLEYLLKYHFEKMHREYYKKLIGDFPDEISHRIFKSRMTDWFMENHFTPKNSMYGFLEKVDRFHLENFLASKRIEGFIIPEGSPIQQNFKRYCGLEQMRQGILDFFNEVIYSNKTGNILLYSSINYEKLTKGDEFRKKILFALAMILKKGNQIHIIHHIERIDRSFIEMITEIETWIPLYMTGQIEPYYFVNKLPEELNHGLYVAPSVATYTMECIARMEENGLATLTKKPEERPYYEALGDYMLSAAKPLMKIYRHTAEDKYMDELEQEMKMAGDWT